MSVERIHQEWTPMIVGDDEARPGRSYRRSCGERFRYYRSDRVRIGSRAKALLRGRRAFRRHFTLSLYYWSP